ncbi:MAG: hypothetical protein ABSC23_12030 [Bryobacteraceae bacterium]|jgi:hypothetical protein
MVAPAGATEAAFRSVLPLFNPLSEFQRGPMISGATHQVVCLAITFNSTS